MFFENFSKFQNFEFSLTFSTIFFRSKIENFWSQKFSTKKFSDFFRRKIFRPTFFGSPIPIPNFPKIPKIILRTTCVHPNGMKNEDKVSWYKKSLFFVLKPDAGPWELGGWDILCTAPRWPTMRTVPWSISSRRVPKRHVRPWATLHPPLSSAPGTRETRDLTSECLASKMMHELRKVIIAGNSVDSWQSLWVNRKYRIVP